MKEILFVIAIIVQVILTVNAVASLVTDKHPYEKLIISLIGFMLLTAFGSSFGL